MAIEPQYESLVQFGRHASPESGVYDDKGPGRGRGEANSRPARRPPVEHGIFQSSWAWPALDLHGGSRDELLPVSYDNCDKVQDGVPGNRLAPTTRILSCFRMPTIHSVGGP